VSGLSRRGIAPEVVVFEAGAAAPEKSATRATWVKTWVTRTGQRQAASRNIMAAGTAEKHT
jgi:hypothetical protein